MFLTKKKHERKPKIYWVSLGRMTVFCFMVEWLSTTKKLCHCRRRELNISGQAIDSLPLLFPRFPFFWFWFNGGELFVASEAKAKEQKGSRLLIFSALQTPLYSQCSSSWGVVSAKKPPLIYFAGLFSLLHTFAFGLCLIYTFYTFSPLIYLNQLCFLSVYVSSFTFSKLFTLFTHLFKLLNWFSCSF